MTSRIARVSCVCITTKYVRLYKKKNIDFQFHSNVSTIYYYLAYYSCTSVLLGLVQEATNSNTLSYQLYRKSRPSRRLGFFRPFPDVVSRVGVRLVVSFHTSL